MDFLPTLGETWPRSRGNGLVHPGTYSRPMDPMGMDV